MGAVLLGRRLGLMIVVALAVLLVSCGTPPPLVKPEFVKSQDEAAAVTIYPTVVIPWSQVSEAFQPKFELSGDQALQQVLPVTARIEEQVLSAFGASIGIGLPQSSTQSTSTQGTSVNTNTITGGADNVSETTSQQTSSSNTTATRAPGSAPAVPTGVPAGTQLRKYSPLAGEVGVDPVLKYQSALALFETVQMLNRQVRNAAQLSDSIPFLVRMKIAVLPYRPRLGYSLHSRISFFGGEWFGESEEAVTEEAAVEVASLSRSTIVNEGGQPGGECLEPEQGVPLVVPLLAADDIERALKSRAVEAAQQIGFALSMMTGGVAGNIGLNKLNQSLAAINGQDFNSRLTIARQSDNTLYVRVGATNEASAGAALVGQTYDVAVLLLVPRSYFDECHNPSPEHPQIRVVSHTQFRNAIDGSVLPDRTAATYVKQVDRVMQQLLERPDSQAIWTAWQGLDVTQKERIARKLSAPIQANDFARYAALFKGPFDGTTFSLEAYGAHSSTPEWYMQNMWNALSSVLADTPMKSAHFELRRPRELRIPPQTALLLDDGKERAEVRLAGVTGESAASLGGSVTLRPKGSQHEFTLAVQSLALDNAAHVLTLGLPSPTKWGAGEIEVGDPANRLTLTQPGCERDPMCPDLIGAHDGELKFPIAMVKAAGAPATPGFVLTAATKRVVADQAGAGRVTVAIEKLEDDSVTLSVSDADVVSVTTPDGAAAPLNAGAVTMKTATPLTIHLHNLRVGARIVVTGEGKKAGKSTGKVSLEFEVAKN